MRFVMYDDDGNEIHLPSHKIVCPTCHGKGRHVNPAIDGNGLTYEDMHDLGEDFLDDYLGGVYDVTCEECGGANVIDEVDEDRMDPELLKEYHAQLSDFYESEAISRQERMMEGSWW